MPRPPETFDDLTTALREIEARIGHLEQSQWSSRFPSFSFGAGLSALRDDLAQLRASVEAYGQGAGGQRRTR